MFILQVLFSCKPVTLEGTTYSADDPVQDFDGDGQSEEEGDCDDTNPDIYSGADEICDQIDNDCDGRVDDHVIDGSEWYLDVDGDGYGQEEFLVVACSASLGYVPVQLDSNGGILFDCNDDNMLVYPTASEVCDQLDNNCNGLFDEHDPYFAGDAFWYRDSDSDSYGISEIQKRQCSQPVGFVQGPEILPPELQDCNDLNPEINPGQDEICDGLDNDCDGRIDGDDPQGMSKLVWTIDADADGYGDARIGARTVLSCDEVDGYVLNTDDCDDEDADISPDATEVCDHVDNNCDGDIDEDIQVPWYADADADGYGAMVEISSPIFDCVDTPPEDYVSNAEDCNDVDATINPSFDEYCDGVDNNCDGVIDEETALDVIPWYFDADLDGYGDINEQILACVPPPYHLSDSTDCDDSDSSVNPGEIEICALNPATFQHRDEDCSGSDNDPDVALYTGGTYFYSDFDLDGYGVSTDYIYACYEDGLYTTTSSSDCDDSNASISPGELETCFNNDDENCDGQVSEEGAGNCTYYFYDFDNDGFGISSQSACFCTPVGNYRATLGGDCDDFDTFINPGTSSCGLVGSVTTADAEFVIVGRQADDSNRKEFLGDFDYNADGIPDIAVVDFGYDASLEDVNNNQIIYADAGALFLYLGPISSNLDVSTGLNADLIFTIAGASDQLGFHGVSAGNWDSDPEDELVVNGFMDAYFIQSGLEGQGIITELHSGVARLPNRSGGGLDATKSIGDVNGDGFVDVVSYYDQLFYGVETIPGNGVDTFLYSGSEMFCDSPTLRHLGADIDGDGLNEWVGVDDYDLSIRQFISSSGMVEIGSIAGVVDRYDGRVEQGDFNGDGYIDLVGSYYTNNYNDQVQGNVLSAGMLYVFNGSFSGIVASQSSDADWGLRGEMDMNMVGNQMIRIDFDGDGFDDLLSLPKDAGESSLFYGPLVFPADANGNPRLALPSDADLIFTGLDSGAANIGDQNQDGAEDLLIREGGTSGTELYLFYGSLNY